MKSSESSDIKKVLRVMWQKHQSESEIMRAIMDFNHIHLKVSFCGLSNREFVMLDLLAGYKEYNPDSIGISVSELADCLNMSMPQVSRLLSSMETKNYIERNVNTKDRRSTYVSITEKGIYIRECALKECQKYMDNVIKKMGKEKTDNLIVLMDELTQIMREERKKYSSNEHKDV